MRFFLKILKIFDFTISMNKKTKDKTTLDKCHKEKMFLFDNESQEENEINRKIAGINKKIDKLNKIEFSQFSKENIDEKAKLLDKLKQYNYKLSLLQSNNNELLYFTDTIDYLSSYYDNSNKNNDIKHVEIVDFFNDNDKINNDKSNNKTKLLDNYLKITDSKQIKIGKNKKFKPKYCPSENCKSEMTLHLSDGYLICTECGFCEEVILDSDKPNYKDPIPDATAYSYKRINVCAEKYSALIIWDLVREKQLGSQPFLGSQMLVVC